MDASLEQERSLKGHVRQRNSDDTLDEDSEQQLCIGWTSTTPSGIPPQSRVCYQGAIVDSILYLIGGYGNNCRSSISMLEMGSSPMKWKPVDPWIVEPLRAFPNLAGHTCTVIGNAIWIIGGRITGKIKCSRDRTSATIYVLDSVRNQICQEIIDSIKPDFHTPCARRMHTATYIPELDAIFLYGGNGHRLGGSPLDRVLGDAFLLETRSKMWKKIELHGDVPGPRAGHTTVLYPNSNFVFIFGGVTDPSRDGSGKISSAIGTQLAMCSDDIFVCDTKTGFCSRLQTTGQSPGALCEHSSGVLLKRGSNLMYVVGGQSERKANTLFTALNMDSGHWQVLPEKGNVPEARSHHLTMTISRGSFVLFGGVTGNGINISDPIVFSGKLKHLHKDGIKQKARTGKGRHLASCNEADTVKTGLPWTSVEKRPWWFPWSSSFEAYKLFIELGHEQYVNFLCEQLQREDNLMHTDGSSFSNIWDHHSEPTVPTSPRANINGKPRTLFQTFNSSGVPEDVVKVQEINDDFGESVYNATGFTPSKRAISLAAKHNYLFRRCLRDRGHAASPSGYHEYVSLNDYLRSLHKKFQPYIKDPPTTPPKAAVRQEQLIPNPKGAGKPRLYGFQKILSPVRPPRRKQIVRTPTKYGDSIENIFASLGATSPMVYGADAEKNFNGTMSESRALLSTAADDMRASIKTPSSGNFVRSNKYFYKKENTHSKK